MSATSDLQSLCQQSDAELFAMKHGELLELCRCNGLRVSQDSKSVIIERLRKGARDQKRGHPKPRVTPYNDEDEILLPVRGRFPIPVCAPAMDTASVTFKQIQGMSKDDLIALPVHKLQDLCTKFGLHDGRATKAEYVARLQKHRESFASHSRPHVAREHRSSILHKERSPSCDKDRSPDWDEDNLVHAAPVVPSTTKHTFVYLHHRDDDNCQALSIKLTGVEGQQILQHETRELLSALKEKGIDLVKEVRAYRSGTGFCIGIVGRGCGGD
jgi:hypothetical protein